MASPRLWVVVALAACGGGGDGGTSYSDFAAKCQTPRTGTDPRSGRPFPDTQGTLDDEKTWLRGWIDDLYLWYREVPDVDPAAFTTAVDYFDQLKTRATTPS